MIRLEPWLLEILNHVSLERLSFELIHNPLERPVLQVKTRGLLVGDIVSGGVILDELVVSMTFPNAVPAIDRLDLKTVKEAHFSVDRMVVKISRDWINKVLLTAPQLGSKGLAAQLQVNEGEPSKVTFAGSFKRTVSFSLDFHLGIQGNLLYVMIDEIRFLKFLPLLSVPGLKKFILNTIKEHLPAPAVRMHNNEVFIDVQSQLPRPVALRWRRFESEGPFIIVEAGS